MSARTAFAHSLLAVILITRVVRANFLSVAGLLFKHYFILVHRVVVTTSGNLHFRAFRLVIFDIGVDDRVFLVDKNGDESLGKTQCSQLRAAIDDVATILWIEVFKLVYADVEHLCNLLEVDVMIHHYCIGLLRKVSGQRTDIVITIIVHHIVSCNESWHITTGLYRELGINFPVVAFSTGAPDRFVELVFAAVVGSNDEVPVAVSLIQVAQIVRCRIGGTHHVPALIYERVHFQSILPCCFQHELPKSHGPCVRLCIGVEGRFDDRKILQF